MKKVALLSIMICIAVALQNCSPYIKVYCDANKSDPVMVLRDINKAYPIYARDYDASIKASVDILGKVNVSGADITFANKVNALRDKLNQETAIMEDLIKSNCIGLASRPCDQSVYAKFDENIKLLSEKTLELAKLRNDIAASIKNAELPGNAPSAPVRTEERIDYIQKEIIDTFNQNYKFLSQGK